MKMHRNKNILWLLCLLFCLLPINAQRKKQTKSKKAKQELLEKKLTQTASADIPTNHPFYEPQATENIVVDLPLLKREFRGAWIATVANINWPSKRNLSTAEQKNEAIHLLDLLQEAHFNAVIFQVRPSADALYKSELEPWSYFLTGETGKAPSPYYDPLEFWIEEAHKRNMELHVWINPYRAHHSSGGAVSQASLVHKMPDNIVRLKNGMYWFDPSHPKTQEHVVKVVRDIVKRYDIDAVHLDDYFYPYASYNGGADFPDQKTWNAYKEKGGHLSRADWRRENVNLIIKRLYKEIKEVKSYVKFGISPFGIWKPGYPSGITGMSQYDELYADAKLWLNEGWMDYFAPQLYWPIHSKGQSFTKLLEWWQQENTHQRHLWPGLNTVEVKATDRSVEICNQITKANELLPSSTGVIHWSIAGLTKNAAMVEALKKGPYKDIALVPKSPWIAAKPLARPEFEIVADNQMITIDWETASKDHVFQWVLFAQYGNKWETLVSARDIYKQTLPKYKNGQKLQLIALKSIDRLGNESDYLAKKI